MKTLLKFLQKHFNCPVAVEHKIDNFAGTDEPIRVLYSAYVQDFYVFTSNNHKPSHSLTRDNLHALKTDVKEQVKAWLMQQQTLSKEDIIALQKDENNII